jgi:hypothetical protein
MALLNKFKRGSHGITIDRDLSTGMSRDLFLLDEVPSFVESMLINSSHTTEFQGQSPPRLMTPFSPFWPSVSTSSPNIG